MRTHSTLQFISAALLTCFALAGCGPKDDPSAPYVPPKSSSKPKSPYTHEYYLAVKELPAQELKKKIKAGMKSEQVQDVLGNASGHDGTAKQGSMSFWRKDGTLKINMKNDIVTDFEITKS